MGAAVMPLLVAAFWVLMLHWLPAWSRPGILFGVDVSPGFASTTEGRRAIRRYRATIWASLAAAAAGLLLFRLHAYTIALLGGHMLVLFSALLRGHRDALVHAVPPPAVRVAALAPRNEQLPGGVLVASGPFMLMGAAALFMAMNWDRIPDPVPLHWGINGPGNWRPKSLLTVYAPVFIGCVASGCMVLNCWMIVRRTRQIATSGAAADAERRFKRTSVLPLLVGAYGIAGITGSLSVSRVIGGADRIPPLLTVLAGAAAALSFAFLLVLIRLGQGGQRAIAIEGHGAVRGDGTPTRAWKAGLIYFNPDDPAMLVEQRIGIGWTLNFGNKWSWIVLAGMIGLMTLIGA